MHNGDSNLSSYVVEKVYKVEAVLKFLDMVWKFQIKTLPFTMVPTRPSSNNSAALATEAQAQNSFAETERKESPSRA